MPSACTFWSKGQRLQRYRKKMINRPLRCLGSDKPTCAFADSSRSTSPSRTRFSTTGRRLIALPPPALDLWQTAATEAIVTSRPTGRFQTTNRSLPFEPPNSTFQPGLQVLLSRRCFINVGARFTNLCRAAVSERSCHSRRLRLTAGARAEPLLPPHPQL